MTMVRSISALSSESIVIVGHVRWGSVLIGIVVRSTAGSKVPVEYTSHLVEPAAEHLER